jgi:hypothetical protein
VPAWLPAALVVAGAVVVGWHGATSIGPQTGFDVPAHIAYAEVLKAEGRLPTPADTYEYASPPGYHWLADRLQGGLADVGAAVGGAVPDGPEPLLRVIWLLALAAGLAALAVGRRLLAGATLAGVALAALAVVSARADSTDWSAGQALSLAAAAVLCALAWPLARLTAPGSRFLPALAVAATAAVPTVLRMGVMFHPEALFAALAMLAVVLFVRAGEHGWRFPDAIAVGALLGAAALVRQTAVAVALGLGLVAVVAGRRAAGPFLAVAGAALVVVAGPWWLHQFDRYGNPIESNLDRPGYLLADGQPLSFFVSFPVRDLVVHPFRPAFQNELLPQFHAELWSDWFGALHGFWGDPSGAARFFASSQSVLGLGADALAVGGLLLAGVPAVRRLLVGGRRPGDLGWSTALVVAAVAWAAFVVTLLRFPQAEGDPIKSTYLLFLAPVFALGGVEAGRRLWRRAVGWRIALVAWCVLYAVSYAGFLATSFPVTR